MRRLIPILLIAAILAAGCVMKDDIVVMDDRIFRLEQRQKEMENRLSNLSGTEDRVDAIVQGANRQNRDDIQGLRGQLADFQAENEALREEVQKLTGRIEEAEFHLQQRSEGRQQAGDRIESRLDRIDAATAENTERIHQLEQYLSLGKERASQAQATPPAPVAEPTEAALYKNARAAFDQEKYTEARDIFEELLKRFPDSQQADNAQFWIGETYYREKWYEKAILEYQKVIEQFPKGNKLPAAMLKQGYAFDQLGDSGNARLVLKELVRKYPDTNEAKIAQEKLQKIK
ncbi:MAG: tol-pal system protein YbgF [Desulfobacterales bacterium]|jgi:tol-pal system protein YbgF